MRTPEEILKGCSDEEEAAVFDYIRNRIDAFRKERQLEMRKELKAGVQVKVIRNGEFLWKGEIISMGPKNAKVMREGSCKYNVPITMIELDGGMEK